MIYFHFCKAFNKKVKGQSFEKNIKLKFKDLSARNHLLQSGKLYDYKNGTYVLETKNPLAKMIIHKVDVSGTSVYFVRDFITIKDANFIFGQQIHPQLKSGEWVKSNPIHVNDIQDYKDDIKKNKDLLIKQKASHPPIELTNWLQEYQLEINYGIFETKDWVSYALNNSVDEGMKDENVKMFGILIQKILNNSSEFNKETINSNLFTAIDGNFGIIYSKHQIDSKDKLMLHNAAHLKTQLGYWEKSLKKIKENDFVINDDIDDLTRNSYRAYPEWTITDDEIWFAIQKNDEYSNLSLTQDQLMFFKKFKFPYYINGQAGSGKSTMLYYLFANAFFFKSLDHISGDLLFITENKALLEHTQKSVFDLINNNPEFDGITTDKMHEMDNQFHAFKEFLLKLIPEEDQSQFKNNLYLSYSRFTTLYENSYLKDSIKTKYSAEESWFTIITYIYGYDSNSKITSSDYLTRIPTKSRKIPYEKFKGIESEVLPFYEKLINEEGYWDKLKVIRHLEINNTPIPKYSLIICDEAQDFCRVELRFILKLSEYLDYDLSSIDEIPIVFAGDPNQTVNPTGFREREMTEMLHTELQQLASFDYNNGDSVYNPLYNYRSPLQVVSLANFVQYYRKKNFDIRLTYPQIPKRPDSGHSLIANTFLDYDSIINDPELKNNLINKIKYKIFVVPIDLTQKETYIKGDQILEDVEGAEIKTAVETKGAEYNQVVLYGFGDYYIKEFGELDHNTKVDEDEIFRQAYFFNKLYVGITRAQSELVIIDSKESQNKFWRKLVNETKDISGNWESLNGLKSSTIEYNPSTVNNVIQSDEDNALENAFQDKTQGVYDDNSARLKVAANQFYKLGNKHEYFSCLALSEELKEDWEEAGNLYMKKELLPDSYEDAARCYFKGKNFDKLTNYIGSKLKSNNQDVRIIISSFMGTSELRDKDIYALNNNRQTLRDTVKSIDWREEFIEKLIKNYSVDREIETLNELAEVYKAVINESDLKLWAIIGALNYKLNNYKESIEAWDRLDLANTYEYVNSKIKLSRSNKDIQTELTWLNNLKYYKKTDEEKDIIDEEILNKYERAKEQLSDISPYFLFSVYSSAIYLQPEKNIHLLGEQVEHLFSNNLPELITSYEKLINDTRISPKIKDYLVSRWAKINYNYRYIPDTKEDWISEINNDYQKIAKINNLSSKQFNLAELKAINKVPDKLTLNPNKHLQNISISNFKRFSNLSLENLGLFNLVVGDNNVGKTTLLEALLFDSNKDIFFNRLAFAYQERMNLARILDHNNNEKYIIPINYPNSFIRKDNEVKNIKYLISENRTEWEYEIAPLGKNKLKSLLSINTGIDEKEYFGYKSGSVQDYIELSLLLKNLVPSESLMHPLVPFGKGYNKDLAHVYSKNIDKVKSIRNEFTKNMKVFIPKIERIIVDTETGGISIEEEGKELAVEIHDFGEGANKLFRILVQLTLHKGGRLMIDEIDAGIHHSRFKDFWRTILEFAKVNMTQIFATTHNLECIRSFDNLLNEEGFELYKEDSRVITLRELPNGNIKSYTRVHKEFNYELENNIEVRGGDLYE